MPDQITVAAMVEPELDDGPHVDAYTAAAGALVAEIRAWRAAVDAADPNGRENAFAAWLARNIGPSVDAESWAVQRAVPTACFADLHPPPPPWVVEPGMTVYIFNDFAGGDTWSLTPFDQRWLDRARSARLAVDRSYPPHDWSDQAVVRADLLDLDSGGPDAWRILLAKARGAAPSKTWIKDADRLLAGPMGDAALRSAARWLALVPILGKGMPSNAEHTLAGTFSNYCRHIVKAMATHGDARAAVLAELRGDARLGYTYSDGSGSFSPHHDHTSILSEANEAVLRGCIWLLSQVPGWPDTVGLLQRTALACLVQAPGASGTRYRSLKGLNSCISALGRIATPEAVTALGRIRLKVRDGRLSNQLARAMTEAAEQAGMTIEDLEEVAVPSFELDGVGCRTIELAAGHRAMLTVVSSTRVEVQLLRPDGKTAKGVPAAVTADADGAAALKALKASAAELQKALPVYRLRLERSWLTGRSWRGDAFRARLLDHPVMAWFVMRLIWIVGPAGAAGHTCMFRPDGGRVDAEGRLLPPLQDDDDVALWHPLHAADPGAGPRWRDALMREGITQPLKQAYRETYPLTPAEESIYSNRFAGHILRQAQLLALARLRGWTAPARIWADVPNDEPLHLRIPAFGLAVEYWTEGAGGDEPEVTDNQAYIFVKTDQVRFSRLHDDGDWRRDGGRGLFLGREIASLTAIPPVVFSEAMRDIDLFVGVASIGHDQTWTDAGAAAQHPSQWRRTVADEYWYGFNSAALSESAQARHLFLQTLVPKLAIAERLRLEERHLVVRGDIHSYRIHIGSGNVAIEPSGSYLCIVPQPEQAVSRQPQIWLPFEGDRLLSVILSKAVLLADDDKITDPTILRQLGR